MNRKYTKQIEALLLGSAVAAVTVCPEISVIKAEELNLIGDIGSNKYEVWNQYGSGTVIYDPKTDPYTICMKNNEDTFLRIKRLLNSEHAWSKYNNLTISYDVEYEGDDENGSDAVSVYGWTENPLQEYYVIDGWSQGYRPPGSQTPLKTVEIDGALYDIYVVTKNAIGGIMGVETNKIFYSVRRDNKFGDKNSGRISGTVSLSKHMDVWSEYGFNSSAALFDTGICCEGFRDKYAKFVVHDCKIITQLFADPDETKIIPGKKITESVVTDVSDNKETYGTEAPETEVSDDILSGDLDNNGTVNSSDLVLMEKYFLGLSDAADDLKAFDINRNGKVDVIDLVMLKSILTGE